MMIKLFFFYSDIIIYDNNIYKSCFSCYFDFFNCFICYDFVFKIIFVNLCIVYLKLMI